MIQMFQRRWLALLVVIFVGGVFAVFLGLQGPLNLSGTGTEIVKVGDYRFGLNEFERVRARRQALFEEQLGGQFDARAMSDTLDSLAARELVETALLAIAAEEMGLTVSKREVERLVLADPGFRDEGGRFDRDRFEDYAEYQFGSQRAFLEDRRLALLSLKMLRLLTGQAEVSEGEARDALERELEEVRIATVSFDSAEGGELPEVADETLSQVVVERGDEIAALYAERGDEYDRPERVRARHILRTVAQDAPETDVAAAQGTIEAAKSRIEAGEDFATVAGELSQDPGSASNGGDLGFFARGQMVPEFENAAFGLEPGGVAIARSNFGIHLIRLEERQEERSVPLDDVGQELARELLRRDEARKSLRTEAESLAEAVRGGASLEDAARAVELDLDRSGWLQRRGAGFVPGLGPAPELLAAAFALEPGESSSQIFEVENALVLVQQLEQRDADAVSVDRLLPERREQMLEAKRNNRTSAWLEARRSRLMDAGELVVNLAALQR
ncbi:MAG: peptidylprolyl isomerase [Myxococcota bacterium]